MSCSCRRRSGGGAAGGEQGPAFEFQSGGGESGPALLAEAGEVQGGASAAGSGGEPASCAFQGGGESGSVSGSGSALDVHEPNGIEIGMERLHPPSSLQPNTPLRSGPTNQPGTLKKGPMPFMPLEIILIPYM